MRRHDSIGEANGPADNHHPQYAHRPNSARAHRPDPYHTHTGRSNPPASVHMRPQNPPHYIYKYTKISYPTRLSSKKFDPSIFFFA